MNMFGAVSLGVAVVACVTDVRTRRIPNSLTFGAAVAALLIHGAAGGWSGMVTAAAGWGVGLVLFLPFFALGGMGAGDVKLLAALGAWLGPREAFWLAVYSSMAGGVVALVVALWHGYLLKALRNVFTLVTYWCLVGPRPMPEVTLEQSPAPRLAYAIPILLGTAITLWL